MLKPWICLATQQKKGKFAAVKNGLAPMGLASKPCPFCSCNSKGTSWRVTLSRDKAVSGSSRTFCHSILLNLASRTRLLCHKELILKYSIPCEYVEEETVRVQEERYEKTKLLALDEGDAKTTTERALIAQEDDEDVPETDGMPTQKSTTSRKQVKDNNFVFL